MDGGVSRSFVAIFFFTAVAVLIVAVMMSGPADDPGDTDPIHYVHDDAMIVMTMDPQSADDGHTFLEELPEPFDGVDTNTSFKFLLEASSNDSPMSDGIDEALWYSTQPVDDESIDDFGVVVFSGTDSADDYISLIEATTGETLEPVDTSSATERYAPASGLDRPHLVTFETGVIAIGTAAGIDDILAIEAGEIPAAGESLTRAYSEAHPNTIGLVIAEPIDLVDFEPTPSIPVSPVNELEGVEYASFAITTPTDGYEITATLLTENTETASTVTTVLEATIALYSATLDDDDRLEALASISIEQEGADVRIEYETDDLTLIVVGDSIWE